MLSDSFGVLSDVNARAAYDRTHGHSDAKRRQQQQQQRNGQHHWNDQHQKRYAQEQQYKQQQQQQQQQQYNGGGYREPHNHQSVLDNLQRELRLLRGEVRTQGPTRGPCSGLK